MSSNTTTQLIYIFTNCISRLFFIRSTLLHIHLYIICTFNPIYAPVGVILHISTPIYALGLLRLVPWEVLQNLGQTILEEWAPQILFVGLEPTVGVLYPKELVQNHVDFCWFDFRRLQRTLKDTRSCKEHQKRGSSMRGSGFQTSEFCRSIVGCLAWSW